MVTITDPYSMPKLPKPKPCQSCQQLVSLRYRIQCDNTEQWYLVCPQCWERLANNNPFYRYGGTWKAR
jgi:hypothetical protein